MSNKHITNNKTDGNLIFEHPDQFIQTLLRFHEINCKNIDSVKNLSHLVPTYVLDHKNNGASNVKHSNQSLRFFGITSSLLDRLQQVLTLIYEQPFEIFTSLNALKKFEDDLPQTIKELKQECFLDVDNKILSSERMEAYSKLSSIKKKIHDLYEFLAQVYEDIEGKQWEAEEKFLEHVYAHYREEIDYFGWGNAEILANQDYFDRLDFYNDPDDFERDGWSSPRGPFETIKTFRF
jgi:hypothetical protein